MTEIAKSLSELLLTDKNLRGTSDASEFSVGLEGVFQDHKLHLESLQVIKFWMLVFLYNVPNFVPCDPDRAISKGYFEVLNDTIKLYYTLNSKPDELKIVSFSFEQKMEHLVPEADDDKNFCFVSWSSQGKTLKNKYLNIDFKSYKISLIQRKPLIISVTIEKCEKMSFNVINESLSNNISFERIKHNRIKETPCENSTFQWTFETWNTLIQQYIHSLFVFAKPSMVAATGLTPDSNYFLVTALNVFFASQPKKFAGVKTELQMNADGEFVGLWAQLVGAPLMFFQYANNLNTSHRLAAHTIALISNTYLQYNIYHQTGTFMLRIREKIHSSINFNQLDPFLFLYPKQVENLVTEIESHILTAVSRNLPDLNLFEYLIGRFLGDELNSKLYNVYADYNNSIIIMQSVAYVVKFSFSDNKDILKVEHDNCNKTFFHGRILPYYDINLSNNNQKDMQIDNTVTIKPVNESCNYKPSKLQRINAIKKFSRLKAEELFNCPECLGRIVMEATNLTRLTFEKTKSLITGLLTGMFPVHSCIGKSLVIHRSDNLESCYQIEFETKNDFVHVEHSVGFWEKYAKDMNLAVKVHLVVIVLSETLMDSDKIASLDSICLQFVHSDARRWKFGAEIPANQRDLSDHLSFNLIIDNQPDKKPESFGIRETIGFETQFNSKQQTPTTKVHNLIIYAQLGANLAFGVRGKLPKLGYSIRTDCFDKVSQIRASQIELKNSTIAIPNYLIGQFKDDVMNKSGFADDLLILEEKLSQEKADQLIIYAEEIGFTNLEIHVSKVSLVNGVDPNNADSSLTETWQTIEANLLEKLLKHYEKTFNHVRFLTVPDIHAILSCSKFQSGEIGHFCMFDFAKSAHTMIDMTKQVSCPPERPINLFQRGKKVESFLCSDDNSKKPIALGFPNENMFSISKVYTEKSLSVISLVAKMNHVLGKSDMSNIFVAENGFISVIGGPHDDVLVLPLYHDGLHGFFDGKCGKNTLLILFADVWLNEGPKKNAFPTIIIDSTHAKRDGAMTMHKSSDPKGSIRLMNVQKIIGRKEKQEKLINVGCHVELVELKGGYHTNWDEITIPKTRENCSTDLHLLLDPQTEIFIDDRQNRYIEYSINSGGPVKINLMESTKYSLLGLIKVKAYFSNLSSINVEFNTDDQSRNISFYLIDSDDQTPFLKITNVRGQVQVKFVNSTLIMDKHNHTLVKNQKSNMKLDLDRFMSNWKLDDERKIIMYTLSNDMQHEVNHNVLILDNKTYESRQYVHFYQVYNQPNNDQPVVVNLDETQSRLINVIDLRNLKMQKTDWDRVQYSAIKSSKLDEYDEVVIWLPAGDKGGGDKILVNFYLTLNRGSMIFIATDIKLMKLVTGMYRFENIQFDGHLKQQALLILDSTSVMEMAFQKMINKIILGEHKISRSHGNLMIEEECEEREKCSSSAIIFWNYDGERQIFDKVANLPGWILNSN